MLITKVTAYTIKADQLYAMSGGVPATDTLPGSDYMRFGDYPQLYSRRSEACLVRIETDTGVVGWGESQAPIGPEVVQTIVTQILAPVVLGKDAEASAVRYSDMYETLRVRGQVSGFQLDAIAGIDTALWDTRGQAVGRSIADLLGGRRLDRLPCYVTGLRADTATDRRAEAKDWAERGIGVKPCLGHGYPDDVREVDGIRSAVGDDACIMVDGMWAYSFAEAVKLGRAFEQAGVMFLESPMVPEDVDGHARLADKLDMPVAIGEPLRGRFAFLPWFQRQALGVAQPDQMRNGVTETIEIARLAQAFHLPVALHTGCVTVVGMAATWQIAATLPNFLIQEYQPVMLDLFNPWLADPLLVDGALHVPTGSGLGLDLDEDRVAAMATSTVTTKL